MAGVAKMGVMFEFGCDYKKKEICFKGGVSGAEIVTELKHRLSRDEMFMCQINDAYLCWLHIVSVVLYLVVSL